MAYTLYFKKKLTTLIEEAKTGRYHVHVFEPVGISTSAGPRVCIVIFDPKNNQQLCEELKKTAIAQCKTNPILTQTWYNCVLEFEIKSE